MYTEKFEFSGIDGEAYLVYRPEEIREISYMGRSFRYFKDPDTPEKDHIFMEYLPTVGMPVLVRTL